jgi:iron complex transport system substrate-binding protein
MSGVLVLATALVAATPVEAQGSNERLVTLGASVTEIVHALGEGDRIVGIDSTSQTVELGREVEDVGFFRRVSAPGLLSLKPTRVIALEDAGPESAFDALAAAEIAVTRVPNAVTVEQATDRIEIIAKTLGRAEAGQRLVDEMKTELAQVERPESAPKVLFVYARGGGAVLVSGTKTSASAMIGLAGGEPAVTAFEGFKPLTPEAVIAAAPDVLLLTDGGFASLGGEAGLREHAVLGQTPAVKSGRVITMDDLRLLGFGPDLGEVARELAAAFAAASEES